MDFLEITMTEMIYVDKNRSRRVQQYSATRVFSNFWVGLKRRQTDRQADRKRDRQTDKKIGL